MTQEQRTFTVLVVEDSPADIMLVRRAVRRCQYSIDLNTVPDGEKALAFMRREKEYYCAPPVDLVLLDINLPGRSGREILEEIKADPVLVTTPVVILTSSSLPSDVKGMYARHASSYLVKPATPQAFDKLFGSFGDYWFGNVSLPGTP